MVAAGCLRNTSLTSTSYDAQPRLASTARPARRCSAVARAKSGQIEAAPAADYKLLGSGPKPFGVQPSSVLRLAAAAFPMIIRWGSGGFGLNYASSLVDDDGKYGVVKFGGKKVKETSQVAQFKRPAKLIEIYEFEGCPFCRKVREAVSILDLDVQYKPCPAGGPTWREEVKRTGGKASFPYMNDPNTGTKIYESDAIVQHLFKEYGDGNVPWGLRLGILTALSCTLALLPRLGVGSRYQKSKLPDKPLELWGYELSPYCKIVREKLVQMEIPFVQHTTVRGSPKRQLLVDKYGKFAVPYLEDPNKKVAMFESSDIINYLEQTYAA
ncbi:hypothetical protein WJX73_004908 [Symbiochloris irregularis]|uniref:GST N-terminal domain-containing protein n=1 Tax=Symbiochloris irregularis TaxID=706552 RepID=A0AAW1NW53_9CHLO